MIKFYRKNVLRNKDKIKDRIKNFEKFKKKLKKEKYNHNKSKLIKVISFKDNFINKFEKKSNEKIVINSNKFNTIYKKNISLQCKKNNQENSFSNKIINQFDSSIKKSMIAYLNFSNYSYNKKSFNKMITKSNFRKEIELNKTTNFNIKKLKNTFHVHNVWDYNYKSKIIHKPFISNYKKRFKKLKIDKLSNLLKNK